MMYPSMKVQFEVWFRASIVLQISSASAINNHNLCKTIAVGALKFVVFSKSSKISVWFTSFSNFCDASLNVREV